MAKNLQNIKSHFSFISLNLLTKMKCIPSFLLWCLISIALVSCQKDDLETYKSLDRFNWSDENYQVLNKFIENYGLNGKHYNKNEAPYAVLDWDQTCAFLDVEEAIMRYQLFNLRYKMTKAEFADLLKNNINGVTRLSDDYQALSLADINQDLIDDYNYLYDQYIGPQATMKLSDVKETPQYSDFIAKLPFLYDGYGATTGIGDGYSYPWVLYLFAGHTIDEVKAMAKEAIEYELGNPLSKQTLQSPANLQTNTGIIRYSYKTGLRILPEMQNLIATFNRNGITVYIVSASYKPVVEVFSGIGTFGYNVNPGQVIGMELATDKNGIILPVYKSDWVKTFRQGKVEAIEKVIKTGLGKNWDPIFSAGDSDGDYEMLTGFPGMKLSLIWNRVKGGPIGTLCREAVDQAGTSNPRYILQGRNENTGSVIPGSATIPLGKTEPKLLY